MDISDGGMWAVGGSLGTFVLKSIFDNFISSANSAKKKKEEERDGLLAKLDATSARIESDMKLMMQAQGHSDGRVHALEKRVDGIANDHRRRIGRLETDMTIVKTTMKLRTDADVIEEGLNENDT
jgi:hypothetical protein